MIRYNDNFYFKDTQLIFWVPEDDISDWNFVFWTLFSFKEFETIAIYQLKKNDIDYSKNTLKQNLIEIQNIDSTTRSSSFMTMLQLKVQ